MRKNAYREVIRSVFLLFFCARLILFLSVLVAPIIWVLWNWLFENIMHLPAITLLQAFGIDLLINSLFFVPLAVIVISIRAMSDAICDEILTLSKVNKHYHSKQ